MKRFAIPLLLAAVLTGTAKADTLSDAVAVCMEHLAKEPMRAIFRAPGASHFAPGFEHCTKILAVKEANDVAASKASMSKQEADDAAATKAFADTIPAK